MRLTQLNPKWLTVDGRRVGFVFQCPHCLTTTLSCFTVPMPHIVGEDYHDCQLALFATVIADPADVYNVVPCRQNFAWTSTPPIDVTTFETMTITPSLDASASGHWHGWITNGEARNA